MGVIKAGQSILGLLRIRELSKEEESALAVASASLHMNILPKIKFKFSKIIFLILILSGFLSLILALQSEPKKTKLFQNSNQKTENRIIPSPSSSSIQSPPPFKSLNPTTKPTSSPIPDQQISISQTISTPTPSPIIKSQVTVYINDSPSFVVNLDEGANQCDVLSKALEQGKITSLNMRYDKNYETYAVYQINGIGKENSVWWVYQINGMSPSKGCSHIKAKNGDNIEWKYLGS